MNPLHQISDPWKSEQPASVDNELICNVNYIKHPPRQHLCVSVFNLKRLSLKMSFSIKSLDSIYISCIRVNLCLTQSINHCQGVLCLYLSSFPTPIPSCSHPSTCYVQKDIFGYCLWTAPSSPAKHQWWRRDPGSERHGQSVGRWRKGRKGSPAWLLPAAREGSPKERCPLSW